MSKRNWPAICAVVAMATIALACAGLPGPDDGPAQANATSAAPYAPAVVSARISRRATTAATVAEGFITRAFSPSGTGQAKPNAKTIGLRAAGVPECCYCYCFCCCVNCCDCPTCRGCGPGGSGSGGGGCGCTGGGETGASCFVDNFGVPIGPPNEPTGDSSCTDGQNPFEWNFSFSLSSTGTGGDFQETINSACNTTTQCGAGNLCQADFSSAVQLDPGPGECAATDPGYNGKDGGTATYSICGDEINNNAGTVSCDAPAGGSQQCSYSQWNPQSPGTGAMVKILYSCTDGSWEVLDAN